MPRPSRPRKPHLPQNCIPFSFLLISHSTGTIIHEPVEKATMLLPKYNSIIKCIALLWNRPNSIRLLLLSMLTV